MNIKSLQKRIRARRLVRWLNDVSSLWEKSRNDNMGTAPHTYSITLASGNRVFRSPRQMRDFSDLVLRSIK